ncbi:pyridoxamine 5'-phosphate oxidase family protein [Chondromyces apiculatus]|uniref:pyridoxamine 5'-phosphate oxidase family protein n=1 Tax=Chondromyces apiculatus TaxID=51 RepID=UPI0005C65CC3|nr:pyridoxamine 5'-phosphate oxidase family protein [Chondromyces apiculatus]
MKELHELLKEFDVAMLITQTPEGFLRARPMAIQNPDDVPGCDVWFVTAEETPKVGEIQQERQVAVACYRPRDRAYLSISARARIERDNAAIQKLWKPEWKTWLPEGPEQAALLKLTLERAEYWEPTGGVLRVLYEQAKALVTGESAAKNLDPVKHVS